MPIQAHYNQFSIHCSCHSLTGLSRNQVKLCKISCLSQNCYGGQLACNTLCSEKIGAREAMEDSMLDFADGVEDNSRLSCQIKVSDTLDGLIVLIPEHQGCSHNKRPDEGSPGPFCILLSLCRFRQSH